jgi:hypothetical protein
VCSGVVALVEDGAAFVDDTWPVRVRAAPGSSWVVVRSNVKWHVPNQCSDAWIVVMVQ